MLGFYDIEDFDIKVEGDCRKTLRYLTYQSLIGLEIEGPPKVLFECNEDQQLNKEQVAQFFILSLKGFTISWYHSLKAIYRKH